MEFIPVFLVLSACLISLGAAANEASGIMFVLQAKFTVANISALNPSDCGNKYEAAQKVGGLKTGIDALNNLAIPFGQAKVNDSYKCATNMRLSFESSVFNFTQSGDAAGMVDANFVLAKSAGNLASESDRINAYICVQVLYHIVTTGSAGGIPVDFGEYLAVKKSETSDSCPDMTISKNDIVPQTPTWKCTEGAANSCVDEAAFTEALNNYANSTPAPTTTPASNANMFGFSIYFLMLCSAVVWYKWLIE